MNSTTPVARLLSQQSSQNAVLTIKYSELIDEYTARLKELGKPKQSIKNLRSAVMTWIKAHSLDKQSPVGSEFADLFTASLNDYIKLQEELGTPPTTYKPRISRIKAIREFYLDKFKFTGLPENFSHRLNYLLRLKGYKPYKFWRTFLVGTIAYKAFEGWSKGASPKQHKLFVVELIEDAMGIPRETLSSALVLRKKGRIPVVGATAYRKRLIQNRNRYGVWTDHLEKQFLELRNFKSDTIVPEGMKRVEKSVWTSTEGAFLPTAKMFKRNFRLFFGFCCLPSDAEDPARRGFGMRQEDLSFALLSDKNLLEVYITQFKKARSGGFYNKSAFDFLKNISGLLNEEGGFLFQKPELASELRTPLQPSKWQSHCTKTRRRIHEILKYLSTAERTGNSEYRVGRDPAEPLAKILKSPQPLFVTMQMIKDMLADVRKLDGQPLTQAVLFRDLVLIALLQANPLRVRMVSIMQFDRHLVREADGSWWLEFKKNDFKNRHFLSQDYRVCLVEDLWEIIDLYRKKYRPRFIGADSCRYVFLASQKPLRKKSAEYRLMPESLSDIIYKRTFQYIPDCPGFAPQSFRHIVATSVVKNNPGIPGLSLAASVLHDDFRTVKKAYAHLQTSEEFQPYNNWFSEKWKKVLGEDSPGD